MQQETPTQKTERPIREINRIHGQYSQDYFETGKVAKVNLSRTLAHVAHRTHPVLPPEPA